MKKKILVAALCLTFLLQDVSVYATGLPSTWARAEVEKATNLNLVPENMQELYTEDITRKEFCTLIVKFLEKYSGKNIDTYISEKNTSINEQSFIDTKDKDILYVNALNIVGGKGNKIFDANGKITREEAATILGRTAKVIGADLEKCSLDNYYRDMQYFSPYAEDFIKFVTTATDETNNTKIMGGVSVEQFSPKTNYTREQAYITLKRMYNFAKQYETQKAECEKMSQSLSNNIYYIETYDDNNELLTVGCAALFDNQGHVLANYNVVEGSSYAKLYDSEGNVYKTETVSAVNKLSDTAILKVEELKGKEVKIGDSDTLKNEQHVYIIDKLRDKTHEVTYGKIDDLSRVLYGGATPAIEIDGIRPNDPLGGIVVNEQGELIGFKLSRYVDERNLSYATPINAIKSMKLNDRSFKDMIEIPSAPKNLRMKRTSDTTAQIGWDEVKGADYYHVYCIVYRLSGSEDGDYFIDDNGYIKIPYTGEYSATLDNFNKGDMVAFYVKAIKDGVESDFDKLYISLRGDNEINEPLKLYSDETNRVFLGNLTGDYEDKDSVYNYDSVYGNCDNKMSIWNENSIYGSKDSQYSVYNDKATNPPIIVDAKGNEIYRLTTNTNFEHIVAPGQLRVFLRLMEMEKSKDDLEDFFRP